MPEYEYKIKTSGDLKALEKAHKGLLEQKKALEEMGKSTAVVDAQIQKLSASLESSAGKSIKAAHGLSEAIEQIRSAGGNVDALVKERNNLLNAGGVKALGKIEEAHAAYKGAGGGLEGIKEAAGIFGKGALAGASAGVAALEMMREGLNKYAEAEEHVAQQDAAMAQRGISSPEFRENVQGLAETLMDQTAVSKDGWMGALTRLIQMGADESNIKQTSEAVKNLAGLTGGDLNSAALLVGKSLNGEFEAFGRLGINIKETGTQTEKLNQLFHELAVRGGGQMEASAETISGQYKKLKNNVEDVFEGIGRGVAQTGIVQSALYGLGTTMGWLGRMIGGPVAQSGNLANGVRSSASAMVEADAKGKKYAETLEKIKTSAANAATQINAMVAGLKAAQDLRMQQETAQADLETARIDAAVVAGVKTPGQAALDKAALKDRLEKIKQANEEQQRRREIGEIDAQASRNVDDAMGLDTAAKEERSKLTKYQQLEEQANKISERFDRKIRPRKIQAEEEIEAKATGVFTEDDLQNAILNDPEVVALEKQKKAALKKFRKENDNFDVAAQTKLADETEKKAKEAKDLADKANEELLKRGAEVMNTDVAAPRLNATRLQTRRLETFNQVVPLLQQEQGDQGANGAQQQPGPGNRGPAPAVSDPSAGLNRIVAFASEQTGTTRDMIKVVEQSFGLLRTATQENVSNRNDIRRLQRDLDILRNQIRNGAGGRN